MYCSFLSSLVQAGDNMIYLLLVLAYHCSLVLIAKEMIFLLILLQR